MQLLLGAMSDTKKSLHVGLFVTCLVDLFRPSVGFAAVRLLEKAGCVVDAPAAQTCCGQPAFNMGDRDQAAALARQWIDAFEPFDNVVAPSGSCAAMVRKHFVELLKDDPSYASRARSMADKTFELTSFLVDVLGLQFDGVTIDRSVTYHDSCSGLRELGIKTQPRQLLNSIPGLTLVEMDDAEVCCGFGGAFSVKYPDLSGAIVDKKITNICQSGASMVLAGDLGCLMNIAGRIAREGTCVEVRHVAELLADMMDDPPIAAQLDGKPR